MIVIHNDGQLITDTNYWMTEQAQGGKVYCSLNAGAVRLLLPRMRFPEVADMEMAKACVISLGPWPEHYGRDAVEILFDDLPQNPIRVVPRGRVVRLPPSRTTTGPGMDTVSLGRI